MKLKILAVVVLGAVGVGAAFVALGGVSAGSATSTRYLTSPATIGDVTVDVAATGTVASSASYGLVFGAAAHLVDDEGGSGGLTSTVTKVEVKVGDTVKKGDVLAVADKADLERQLENATNDWRVAKINLANAEDALDDASGTDETRQAKSTLYAAQIQVSNTQQQRKDLASQIKRATLVAPIDGIVTAVNALVGLPAPTGDAIVVASAELQVTTDVVEGDLASMAVGQQATVTIDAVDAEVTGTVTAISPVAAESTDVASYPVTVALVDAPAAVRAGMTADVVITINSAIDVLTVPAEALSGTDGDRSVMTLDATGQPRATPVEVGLVTNTVAEIISGLAEGQTVVTGTSADQNGTTTTGGAFPGGGVIVDGGFRPGPGGGTRNGNGGATQP